MSNKAISIVAVVTVVVGVGMFYAGMQYDRHGQVSSGAQRDKKEGDHDRPFRSSNGVQGSRSGRNNPNGDFVAGEVLSRDEKSITIKTRDGGSRTVYFSDATSVGKSVNGGLSDIAVGQQVMTNGMHNPDGSLTAQNIQIRPDGEVGEPGRMPDAEQ